ncbi:MAG: methyltransferase domain-containing protein [Dehalococcoidia bacterium]
MFDSEQRSRAHYQRRARLYDWANRFAALVRGTSQMGERRKAVARLVAPAGARVIEVSVGTGTNLPLIADQLGADASLVGIDISRAMLGRCREKARRHRVNADLIECEAAHLPFADETFDAVFHHGGFAEFGDKQRAVDEMLRIARPGAKVVICDACQPSDRKLPLMSRLLLRTQPEYAVPPPLDLVPADATLSWFHGGAWYLIEFIKAR